MTRSFFCSAAEPVVDTCEGKLHGFVWDGIYTFHGIRYAKANRFHMPEPVEPWEGVREATNYGYICPVNGDPAPSGEIYIPHRFWPANENCQFLNIWTKSLDRTAKKPVMVWLHGGGYASGSSIEQVAYEGDALADYGDVVVVTLNHRLNLLGFLDLSAYGKEYENSANVGMADIVEALRWVKRNIEGFGGDPDNVTVFGQSGGGGKVQTLMQIPAAEGLFHRAIIMSGIFAGKKTSPSQAHKDHQALVEEMRKELRLENEPVSALERVPLPLLYMACNRASVKLAKEGIFVNWEPLANDWYLGDPMVVGFTEFAKRTPTMAGSVIAEFSEGAKMPAEDAGEKEKLALIKKQYGTHAKELTALFREAYPDKDISGLLRLDNMSRLVTTEFIEKKAEVSAAPCYLYLFALDFDVNGKRPAWHCADIPFVFHNTHRVPCCNMEGVTEKLEDEVAGAFVSFARYGDPNHAGMRKWRPYSAPDKSTMVFDRNSCMRDNYDRALVETLAEVYPPFEFRDLALKRLLASEESEEGRDWVY